MDAKEFLKQKGISNNDFMDSGVADLIETLLTEYHALQLQQGGVSGSFLFDKSLLDKAIIKQPYYAMGVDTYDKNALAYCLSRKVDGVVEILLCKTMREETEFKQEVENLAKYFNADVFRSGE